MLLEANTTVHGISSSSSLATTLWASAGLGNGITASSGLGRVLEAVLARSSVIALDVRSLAIGAGHYRHQNVIIRWWW